jgi:SAM-dependent methyltransferase
MRWLLKAATHNVLSYLPRGETLNYVLQSRVTNTLPLSNDGFRRKAARAVQHRRAYGEHDPGPEFASAQLYEFGAGWDLIVPLTLHALGARRQTLVDIRPNVRLELVDDTLAKLAANRDWLAAEAGVPVEAVDTGPVRDLADLRTRFGITYLAPADARSTGLPTGSVDLVSSTDTFEHIPPQEIAAILRECARLLTPRGILSCRIDLEDHYARVDPRLSRYNFLRYSDRAWRLLSPPLHSQNRLRASDYRRLFADAGFELVEEQVSRPSEDDLEALRAIPLAPRFRDGYSLEDLGTRGLVLVARRRTG